MSSSESILTVAEAEIGYPDVTVLSDVNFRLQAKSFTGVLGSNGSGKSTLLKSLLGILPLRGGRIETTSPKGTVLQLGYVPQRESLDSVFPLSAMEMVLMGACAWVPPARFYGKEAREWARQCMHQTGVADLAAKPFSHLSGGQKQRVLIARALTAKPDLLVLDEPTAGVDVAATTSILELLKRLQSEQGLSILMVNHDLSAIRQTAEQILWVREGRVAAGSASEILHQAQVEALTELRL